MTTSFQLPSNMTQSIIMCVPYFNSYMPAIRYIKKKIIDENNPLSE